MSFGATQNLCYSRENYFHEDGSSFSVDWYPQKPKVSEESINICLIVPGLGSTSKDVRMITIIVYNIVLFLIYFIVRIISQNGSQPFMTTGTIQ